MRLVKITDRSQLKTGLRVRFVYSCYIIRDAKLYCQDSRVFVCQNEMVGIDCGVKNRQGYANSFAFYAATFVCDAVSGLRAVLKEGETL